MSESYRLQTPEHVAFSYDVAGVGSRFMAALADTLILAATILAVVVVAGWLSSLGGGGGLAGFGGTGTVFSSAVTAVATLLSFLLLFGYYIFFEMVWNGQSPGKRWAKLRVIRGAGYPITLVDSVLRNLLRLVDFLPAFYALGIVVMIADPHARRLGDIVAGTIVVKERPLSLDDVARAAITASGAPPSLFDLPNRDRLTVDDLRLVRGFLDRRGSLPPERRRQLGYQISEMLMVRLETRQVIYDREAFLEQIANEV